MFFGICLGWVERQGGFHWGSLGVWGDDVLMGQAWVQTAVKEKVAPVKKEAAPKKEKVVKEKKVSPTIFILISVLSYEGRY